MIALTTSILSTDVASSNIPSARQASQGMGPELMKRKDFNSKDLNFHSAAFKTEQGKIELKAHYKHHSFGKALIYSLLLPEGYLLSLPKESFHA